MKISYYVEENIKQLNLIPENKYEKDLLENFKDRNLEIEFEIGSFSKSQGGYVRFYQEIELNSCNLFMVLKEKQGDEINE